jgi:hypothetical protein
MGAPRSSVGRLETTADNVRLATVDRYAAGLGYVIQYHLLPPDQAAAEPPVVIHRRDPAPAHPHAS